MQIINTSESKMKNKVWIFIILIVVVLGVFVFYFNNKGTKNTNNDEVISKNTNSDEIVFNKDEHLLDSSRLRDLLLLGDGEGMFYLLDGKIGEDKQVAYLHIKEDIEIREYKEEDDPDYDLVPLVLNISLPNIWNEKSSEKEYISIPLDSKKVYFAKDKDGALVISGIWSAIFSYDMEFSSWEENSIYKNQPFYFRQNLDSLLNEIDFVRVKFSVTKDVKQFNENTNIFYKEMLESPIITQNIPNKDKLNKAFAWDSADMYNLRKFLNRKIDDNFKAYEKNEGFEHNTEFMENYNVYYIDDRIIAFSKLVYQYLGGAHGAYTNTMDAYLLSSGDRVSNKIDDLLNIDEQNKEQFLALLNPYLQSQKDKLYSDSLPLEVMPSGFFISTDGIIFNWGSYEISPYSSGGISILVKYDELREWLNPNSPFAYLF